MKRIRLPFPGALIASALLAVTAGAAPPAGTMLTVVDRDGHGMLVTTSGEETEALQLPMETGTRVHLDFQPTVLQARAAGTVVLVAPQAGGHELKVSVISPDGTLWRPLEDVLAVQLSPTGRHVLVQTPKATDGIPHPSKVVVYDEKGRRIRELPLEAETAAFASFSEADDAILLYGDFEDGSQTLELHPPGQDPKEVFRLPPGHWVEEAVALDRERVFSLGNGTLRLHRFGARGTGETGWTRRPETDPYESLRGVSTRLAAVLVSRGFGRYEVVDANGTVLHQLDLSEAPLRSLASESGSLQPMLLGSGDIELTDRASDRRFLLRWPDSELQVLSYDKPTGAVDPDRRFVVDPHKPSVEALRLTPVEMKDP
jgi:hypothetical protein